MALHEFLATRPGQALAVGAGAVALGGIAVAGVRARRRKPKTSRKKTTKTITRRKKRKSVIPRAKKRRWYGKTKSKKIRLTSKGQPYVILASGKARFIKKSRAKSMKKRSGGYR